MILAQNREIEALISKLVEVEEISQSPRCWLGIDKFVLKAYKYLNSFKKQYLWIFSVHDWANYCLFLPHQLHTYSLIFFLLFWSFPVWSSYTNEGKFIPSKARIAESKLYPSISSMMRRNHSLIPISYLSTAESPPKSAILTEKRHGTFLYTGQSDKESYF